ncbi:hypothetical protein [Actinokineospora globicatena]|uniref:hypothetical protein n=1 Tax=Actinokineospora globicatena TaxID=103729 RepID=UPI0020A5DA53|nr:hypothetical protein [Actinokineospora globicatena]
MLPHATIQRAAEPATAHAPTTPHTSAPPGTTARRTLLARPSPARVTPTAHHSPTLTSAAVPLIRVQPPVQRAGKPTLGRDTAVVRPVISTPQATEGPVDRPVVRPTQVPAPGAQPSAIQQARSQPTKAGPPAVRRNPVAPAKPPPPPPARNPPRAKATPVQRRATQAKPPEKPPGNDLEELARGLLDPLLRLLRAELRHGRERAGHRNDHRR